MTRPLPGDDAPPFAGTLYVQPLELPNGRGGSVAGHLISAISEGRVMRHGEHAAKARRPAVLLAAGAGDGAHALDGLIVPLHDAGVIVLSLPLARSEDRRTFGSRERGAIAAAVETLRRRPDVDAARVSVIATGDAATAALLAARDGTAMTHLILHDAPANFDAVLDNFAVHPALRPLCRWAMQVAMRVDVDELDADGLRAGSASIVLDASPAHPTQRRGVVRKICAAGKEDRQSPTRSGVALLRPAGV
jgi:hypothetical protein